MYITGAIGSSYVSGEAFDEEYRLPNDTAYAETCAAIGLAMFAGRMSCLEADSRYADTVERVIYNGFLSGISLDGKAFFYENANEIDLAQRERIKHTYGKIKELHLPITQRVELFFCSCCPPNIARFIPSLGSFIYSHDDETVYVHQYMNSEADIDGIILTQTTDYPNDGKVSITVRGGSRRVALRIPSRCASYELYKNQVKLNAAPIKGYAYTELSDGDTLTLTMKLEAQIVKAAPEISADRGLSAVTYGPFVMCMEGVDNGGSIFDVRITDRTATLGYDAELAAPVLDFPAVHERPTAPFGANTISTPFTARFVPYYTFANRGESDMRIWVDID